jgi:anti-anti-sigma factor
MNTDPEIEVGFNPDRTTSVRIAGEVSSATHSTLRAALDDAAGTGPLIVDLTGVTHLDSAGVSLLREVAGDRGLEVVMAPDCPVFAIVHVSGLCDDATVQCR